MARKKRTTTETSEGIDKAETPRDRFLRLAPKRTRHAIKAIQLIGNFGAANYESTDAERAKIIAALNAEVDEVMRRMSPKESKPPFEL